MSKEQGEVSQYVVNLKYSSYEDEPTTSLVFYIQSDTKYPPFLLASYFKSFIRVCLPEFRPDSTLSLGEYFRSVFELHSHEFCFDSELFEENGWHEVPSTKPIKGIYFLNNMDTFLDTDMSEEEYNKYNAFIEMENL